jgi:hypothetical protein
LTNWFIKSDIYARMLCLPIYDCRI